MNITTTTPLKSNNNDNQSTPLATTHSLTHTTPSTGTSTPATTDTTTRVSEEVDQDQDQDQLNELDFQHLRLDPARSQYASKRTIEGSPMINGTGTSTSTGTGTGTGNYRKRIDLKNTPDLFRTVGLSSDELGASIPYNMSSTTTPQKDTSGPPLPPTPTLLSPQVHVKVEPESSRVVPKKVFVITSGTETGAQHHTTPGHQENAQRTALLSGKGDTTGCLFRPSVESALIWADKVEIPSKAASMADILRVHDYTYVQHLINKCEQVSKATSEINSHHDVPFFHAPPGNLDCDTPLSQDSLDAARNFCGAAIAAVDVVLDKSRHRVESSSVELESVERAFVIGRPPGHHAGPSGCVPSEHFWLRPDMTSSGFCLLNTVAMAAAYARYNYSIVPRVCGKEEECVRGHPPGSRPLRVAIVDIDVHHGNGTEEIVKNLSPHMTYMPLPSSWAPVGHITYKPWLNEDDANDVCFASINLFADDRFYPGSGKDTDPTPLPAFSNLPSKKNGGSKQPSPHSHGTRGNAAKRNSNESSINEATSNDVSEQKVATDSTTFDLNCVHVDKTDTNGTDQKNIINIAMTPIGPGPWDPVSRSKLSVKQRDELCRKASFELRQKVSRSLLPKLRDFSADLLIFSSGFDAHYDDLYHFLTEDDFHWLTREIMEACSCRSSCSRTGEQEQHSAGGLCRVVSVLEGGYSLSTTTPLPRKASSKRGKGSSTTGNTSDDRPPSTPPHPFAVCQGDGGLVKGVLAHVSALANTENWLSNE